MKREPVTFIQAVKAILYCEVARQVLQKAGQIGQEIDPAFDRMSIQPAIYYMDGMDKDLEESLRKTDEAFDRKLRIETGQHQKEVFRDMFAGHTVTKELAEKTKAALEKVAPDETLGDVGWDIRSVKLPKGKPLASTFEHIKFS